GDRWGGRSRRRCFYGDGDRARPVPWALSWSYRKETKHNESADVGTGRRWGGFFAVRGVVRGTGTGWGDRHHHRRVAGAGFAVRRIGRGDCQPAPVSSQVLSDRRSGGRSPHASRKLFT